MIPPIARFTIILNTVLAVIVSVDVYKELKRHTNNVSSGYLPNDDNDGSKLPH